MESDDIYTVTKVPYSNLHVGVHDDISTMTHAIHARLETGLGDHLIDRVFGELAIALQMDKKTLMLFLRFMAEDDDLQNQFLAWRAARRLTE